MPRLTSSRVRYRYYTCWNRARYNVGKCDLGRLNADDVDGAVLDALTSFYRVRHALIREAIIAEQTRYRAAHADRLAELAAIEAEITTTGQAIDRDLAAFERGRMDEDMVADRLAELRATTRQLRVRRDELMLTRDDKPIQPEPTTLDAVTDHITEIINSGTHNQTNALVEELVANVLVTAPDRLVPVFRVPQTDRNDAAASALPAETAPKERFAQ
jgi:site-specific DNA recombinase